VFTTVAFPEYFDEINAMSRDIMTKAGKTEAEIAASIDAVSTMQTPLGNAFAGFVGTVITGIVASALIAIWVRARPGSPQVSGSRV